MKVHLIQMGYGVAQGYMCKDVDAAITELVEALEAAVFSMEKMDARLLKDVTYHNVEKGDITRAKKVIDKYKKGG